MAEAAVGLLGASSHLKGMACLDNVVGAVPAQTRHVENTGVRCRVAAKTDTQKAEVKAGIGAQLSETKLGDWRHRRIVLDQLLARGSLELGARRGNDTEAIGEEESVIREGYWHRWEAAGLGVVVGRNGRDVIKLQYGQCFGCEKRETTPRHTLNTTAPRSPTAPHVEPGSPRLEVLTFGLVLARLVAMGAAVRLEMLASKELAVVGNAVTVGTILSEVNKRSLLDDA